jgi:hypothetical protein
VCHVSLPSSYRSRRGHIHQPRVLPLVGCRSKTPTLCFRRRAPPKAALPLPLSLPYATFESNGATSDTAAPPRTARVSSCVWILAWMSLRLIARYGTLCRLYATDTPTAAANTSTGAQGRHPRGRAGARGCHGRGSREAGGRVEEDGGRARRSQGRHVGTSCCRRSSFGSLEPSPWWIWLRSARGRCGIQL